MATTEEMERLKRHKAGSRAHQRRRRESSIDAGRCVRHGCCEPAEGNRTMCRTHLDAQRESTQAWMEQLERDEAALRKRPYSLPVRSA